MAQQNIEQYLQAGIRAAQSGNKARARELLETVLKRDQNQELAWIWLASVVDSQRERQICLQKVLQINPGNRPAREAINDLVGILGENVTIDYNSMARASRQKLAAGVSGGDSNTALRSAISGAADNASGGINRGLLIGGLAFIAIVLAALLLFLSLPTINSILNPTETPTPTREIPTVTPTPTLTTTPAGGGVAGALIERATFTPAPTITPLPSVTPSVTPMPTATLPPLQVYDLIFTVDESLDTSLYYFDVENNQARIIGNDVGQFDYNSELDRIVFLRDGVGDGGIVTTQVFIGSPENTNSADAITRLGEGLAASSVAISPDGLRVIYSVLSGNGDDDLYIYDTTTGLSRNVTDTPESDIQPHWVTNDRVIFASDRESPGFYDLYELNVSSNEVERIYDGRGSNLEPRVSPDGEDILFVSEVGSDRKIQIIDSEGRGIRDLTNVADVIEGSPTWTIDGRYVLFTSEDTEGNVQLKIQSPGEPTQTIPTNNVNILTVRAVNPR